MAYGGSDGVAVAVPVPVPVPVPYKLLVSCPCPLRRGELSVVFHPKYDRIPHPQLHLDASIAQIWDAKALLNSSSSSSSSSLYNGTKFRYGGHLLHPPPSDQDHPHPLPRLHLHLGLTDYRTFMGTNLNPLCQSFLLQSQDETVRCQHTSNPLGNGAIVETSDERILVLKRSNNVDECPGHYVFPGGHPEPGEIGIVSHHNLDPAIHTKVALEMFDSIIREVVEETGVPAKSLHEPVFIGISRRELNVRPTAFFFMKCILPSEEVQKLYGSAQDGFESTQLHAVSKDELENMAWKMPGCHHGGFALYRLMLEATKS